jgi:hypothetical protein
MAAEAPLITLAFRSGLEVCHIRHQRNDCADDRSNLWALGWNISRFGSNNSGSSLVWNSDLFWRTLLGHCISMHLWVSTLEMVDRDFANVLKSPLDQHS